MMLDGGGLVEAGARHDHFEPAAETVGFDRARDCTVFTCTPSRLPRSASAFMNAFCAPITEEPIM